MKHIFIYIKTPHFFFFLPKFYVKKEIRVVIVHEDERIVCRAESFQFVEKGQKKLSMKGQIRAFDNDWRERGK